MNVFRLDNDPRQAARDHCDKHVVKMIVESAQLLSAAHPPDAPGIYKYSKSQAGHPCAIWVRGSINNYAWLYRLGVGLCIEYTERYKRTHATQALFEKPLRALPDLPNVPETPMPQCMPEQYKGPDSVVAYRRLYVGDKIRFARWAHSARPAWLDEYLMESINGITNSR